MRSSRNATPQSWFGDVMTVPLAGFPPLATPLSIGSNAIGGCPCTWISMWCAPGDKFKCWNVPSKSSTTPA